MALIASLDGSRARPLAARTLIGRSAASTLRLDEPLVSGEHATLTWTGTGWVVRDLGSRNGTWLEGQRLEPGASALIDAGARLGFGQREGWLLAEGGPPGAVGAELESGALLGAEGGLLALPSSATPEATVYLGDHGWTLERASGEAQPLDDGAVVRVAERSYRLHLPLPVDGTPMAEPGLSLSTVRLRFAVSRDEEFVDLRVLYAGGELRLDPHDHHYLLLTLARLRLEDRELPESERGWVERDELLRMLGTNPNALNVAIYRARQQLLGAGVEGGAGVVEVRGRLRRLGTDRLEITQL